MGRVLRLRVMLAAGLVIAACGPPRGTIGAVLGQAPDGGLTIRDVPDGLAAHEAGLAPGDQVLLIDGYDVRMMDAAMVHERLSGVVGEEVKLTVLRGDEVIRVTLRRTPAEKWPAKQAK